jgi:hypothetical protein
MARIFTEGFEMGDLLSWDVVSGPIVSAGGKRSGDYGLYTWFGPKGTIAKYFDTPLTELYFRIAYYSRGNYAQDLYFDDTYGDSHVRLDVSGGQNINLYVNGSSVSTGSIMVTGVWDLIEIYIKIATEGQIIVKRNGIQDINYEGNTNPDGDNSINNMRFYFDGAYADDIAVNDTTGTEDNSWCGDGHIIAIKPNGNGDSSQLTGSDGDSVDNYLLVDDIPKDDDTTYVWGETVDNQDLYNLEAPSLPVNHKIKRIYAEARAKDPDIGNIALPIKSGTTQSDGTTKGLTTEYSAIKGDEYTVNPDTGLPWTESDLNALQAGIKIKS